MSALLQVRGLAKAFGGVHAVQGVDLALRAGEILALIGPNGAGKSTCFNMLSGQIRPDAGTIRLDGQDIAGLDPGRIWRLGVGRTFQITATFSSMTVAENIQVALMSHGRGLWRFQRSAARLDREAALRLLRLVGMEGHADLPCDALAYGDLKRVDLAIALANRPRLLLMDEPTAGMAPGERTQLMRLTAEIARRDSVGVLFTEHDMDAVFDHADRIMVLNRGRVIANADPATIRQDPQVRALYLGEGSLYDARHDAADIPQNQAERA